MTPIIRIGIIVMRKPQNTYHSPSPSTTVCQNPAPALMPTLAKKSTSPTSRSNKLADVVV